jgi:hypothetical protein
MSSSFESILSPESVGSARTPNSAGSSTTPFSDAMSSFRGSVAESPFVQKTRVSPKNALVILAFFLLILSSIGTTYTIAQIKPTPTQRYALDVLKAAQMKFYNSREGQKTIASVAKNIGIKNLTSKKEYMELAINSNKMVNKIVMRSKIFTISTVRQALDLFGTLGADTQKTVANASGTISGLSGVMFNVVKVAETIAEKDLGPIARIALWGSSLTVGASMLYGLNPVQMAAIAKGVTGLIAKMYRDRKSYYDMVVTVYKYVNKGVRKMKRSRTVTSN